MELYKWMMDGDGDGMGWDDLDGDGDGGWDGTVPEIYRRSKSPPNVFCAFLLL